MKLSIIMPCWRRPQRTERAIRSVLAQEDQRWELLCVGDACPVLPGVASRFTGDDRIRVENMPGHEGRYGTQCLNRGIELATGEYVCFMGNDDFLTPQHTGSRLGGIVGTDFDLVHHDALIAWPDGWRVRSGAKLAHGHVGGSELVVRREFLIRHGITFRSGDYGHDWTFIDDLLKAGAKHAHCASATYVVTHLPGNLIEHAID